MPWETVEGTSCPNNNCIHDTGSTFAHGEEVSSAAAAKSNSVGNIGVYPGANVLPVRVFIPFYDNISRGIIYAANRNVHAINVSLTNIWNDPIYYETDVNAAISYAKNYKNIPVAVSAGNHLKAIQSNLTTDSIVVGGTMPDYSRSNTYVAWITPPSNGGTPTEGSNYFSGTSGNPISLSAAAYAVGAYTYNPSQGTHSFLLGKSGTSLSSPMVAMTMAMMKILNPSLNVNEIKNIVTHTSTLRTYSNSQTYSPPRYLGKNLEVYSINNGLQAGIRDLNVYNALVVAYNKKFYSHITRSYNIDDEIYSSHYTTSHLVSETDYYGYDSMYDISLSPTNGYLTFFERNYSGGCTYGYQVYSTNDLPYYVFDYFGGVSGVIGLPPSTNCQANSWNYNINYSL